MARKRKQTRRFRALIGLSYPTAPSLIAHLAAGGAWPETAVVRRAAPGEVVDDIPEASVAWLLEAGAIEPVEEGADAEVE